MEPRHFESLSLLKSIEMLAQKYAKLNADWLVEDMPALSAFVDLRRGASALKDHHHVLETLANERSVERRRDLMDKVRARKELS